MNESEWTAHVKSLLDKHISGANKSLSVKQGEKISYAYEIKEYGSGNIISHSLHEYETDLIIAEQLKEDSWIPRLIIEMKFGSITTHDAITYSEKASNHKRVHPYLRYGIMIGAREHYPLPGRLYRHGLEFDFMLSWAGIDPDDHELDALIQIVEKEVEASQLLEEMIFMSRSPKRERYYVFHKPLLVSKMGDDYGSA